MRQKVVSELRLSRLLFLLKINKGKVISWRVSCLKEKGEFFDRKINGSYKLLQNFPIRQR